MAWKGIPSILQTLPSPTVPFLSLLATFRRNNHYSPMLYQSGPSSCNSFYKLILSITSRTRVYFILSTYFKFYTILAYNVLNASICVCKISVIARLCSHITQCETHTVMSCFLIPNPIFDNDSFYSRKITCVLRYSFLMFCCIVDEIWVMTCLLYTSRCV